MQITLRRANKLRVKLEARVNEVARLLQSPQATFSVYSNDIPTKLLEFREAYTKTMARHGGLNNALTKLRRAIANENTLAGISDLLATTAGLERERNVLRGLKGADLMPDTDEVSMSVSAKRNSTNTYRNDDTVMFGFINEEMLQQVEKRIAEIDLLLSQYEDSREGLNASTKITMDDASVAILKAESLI